MFASMADSMEMDHHHDYECDDKAVYAFAASTYRPLSNLPTPPASSRNSSALQSPRILQELPLSLLGPAIHLVNMLPPKASLASPSVDVVHAMLSRAQLPLDTVALAVCILDSLDLRFSRTWRRSCPFSAGTTIDDAVSPELIILTALVIAAKFTDDGELPARVYCGWATDNTFGGRESLWTTEQLSATERCIMQSLNYRIMPLMDADLLADARADMRRAGRNAERQQQQALARSFGGALTPDEDMSEANYSTF